MMHYRKREGGGGKGEVGDHLYLPQPHFLFFFFFPTSAANTGVQLILTRQNRISIPT